LQHLFRVRWAAENAHDDTVGESAVPVVELSQRALVARGDAEEKAEIDR
jgi:hypothetical protein